MEKCLICDIDGTLALRYDRRPFEWDKINSDRPNLPIINMLHVLSPCYVIILVSGRPESCRDATIKWLDSYDINYGYLFMRPDGNYEKDCLIKDEIYQTKIKNKFNVEFVIDDRDQTVDMWRKDLGLTCLQVNYGDF